MIDAVRERMTKGSFRGLAKFNARPYYEDVETIAKYISYIIVHPSIQRKAGNSGESGWDKKNQNEYLYAFFSSETDNSVMVVDCRAALRHNKRIGDKKSINFFEDQIRDAERGYRDISDVHVDISGLPVYLSIDGNNTASTLSNFYLSKVPYVQATNSSSGEVWYKELPENQKRAISSKYQVPFVILEDITVDEATELFQNRNKQTNLNPQEHRQARITPLADFVRDTANEEKALQMFKNIFKPKELDQRHHEQMVARFVCAVYHPKQKRDKKLLDKLYEETYQLAKDVQTKVEKIINFMTNMWEDGFVGETIKKSVKQSDIALLFLTLKGLVGGGIEPTKSQYRDFLEKFFEVIWKLQAESANLPAACNEWNFNHIKGNSAINAENSSKAVDMVILRFKELGYLDCGNEGSIVSRKRNSSHGFSFKQKATRLAKQNFEVGGKKINILEFYQPNNNLLHADHIVPFSKGGETTPDNLDLLSPLENQAKGDRMPEQASV
jgi:hypothetical protein